MSTNNQRPVKGEDGIDIFFYLACRQQFREANAPFTRMMAGSWFVGRDQICLFHPMRGGYINLLLPDGQIVMFLTLY